MKPGTRQETDAVFRNGVLEPLQTLDLDEDERVRLVVEKPPAGTRSEGSVLLARLREGFERMSFRSTGPYPGRERLHDRD